MYFLKSDTHGLLQYAAVSTPTDPLVQWHDWPSQHWLSLVTLTSLHFNLLFVFDLYLCCKILSRHIHFLSRFFFFLFVFTFLLYLNNILSVLFGGSLTGRFKEKYCICSSLCAKNAICFQRKWAIILNNVISRLTKHFFHNQHTCVCDFDFVFGKHNTKMN